MDIEQEIKSSKQMDLYTKTTINMLFTSRIVEEHITLTLKGYDLTSQQFNVLRILRGQQGTPANLSTIQERMIDKNSNTTRLIDKLITKRLVKRQVCKHNRRKIELFITSKGLEILKSLDPKISENNKKVLHNLSTKELEQLNILLDKLRN